MKAAKAALNSTRHSFPPQKRETSQRGSLDHLQTRPCAHTGGRKHLLIKQSILRARGGGELPQVGADETRWRFVLTDRKKGASNKFVLFPLIGLYLSGVRVRSGRPECAGWPSAITPDLNCFIWREARKKKKVIKGKSCGDGDSHPSLSVRMQSV